MTVLLATLLLQDGGPWIDAAVRGDSVAVASQGKVLLNGKPVETSIRQITGVAFAPDGSLAVFGGRPAQAGEVEVVGRWKAADHSDLVMAVAFGAGWVATASQDRTIVVRDGSGKPIRVLKGHTAAVLALAVSPDGKRLVSGGADATLRVWDPETGELKRTIANHHDRVAALAWSPDGTYLASGSADRTMRVWQPEIGRLVRIVRGFEGEVTDIAWGEDLAAACGDGKVRLIDPESDRVLREWDAGAWVHAVTMTAHYVVAASDRMVRWAR